MSENKLVEKTRKVLDTQNELSVLIKDLKDEVKKVYYQNEKLIEENAFLQRKISSLGKTVKDVKAPDEPVGPTKQVEVKEVDIKEVEHIKEVKPIKEDVPKKPNVLTEFFLGKNVIAKIASVLIFLGILSFGQIAYVEWLNDVGRVLLIMFGGFVFGGIAYYTEKKDMIVFSSVFYGLGVFIIYYSLVLAHFGFELFNESILSYLLVILIVGVFIYFWNKRYEFLDSLLYIFYMVVGLTILMYFDHLGGFSQYIEIILFVGLLGYISYKYIAVYYKENQDIQLVLMSIFTLSLIIYLLGFSFKLAFGDYDLIIQMKTAVMAFNIFMYSALVIYFVYLINLISKIDEDHQFRVLLPIYTVALIGVSSYALLHFADIAVGIHNGSFSVLLFVILAAPLYTYLYIEDKKGEDNFSQAYLIIIAIALLIYSFVAGNLGTSKVSGFVTLNIILGLEVLLFYILAKFTKDENHRFIGIGFICIFVVRNIAFYLYEGSFLFKESGVIFVSMAVGLILVVVYELFKRLNLEDNQTDNIVAHSTNLLMLIPVVVTFTNDLLSDDLAYIFTTVVVLLIGYRWLVSLEVFSLEHKKYLYLGINLGIIFLTLFLNSFYFDHNYKIFEDVFKFWILFLINGYVVLSIKEIYVEYGKERVSNEEAFIFAYLVGVVVHSIFIHNYINIEFDRVILSSYFLIASAVAILLGFKQSWSATRYIGLGAIYFSLGKFFIYDIYSREFTTFTKMVTYFILGFILLGIALLYAYLEKTYGKEIAESKE